MKKLLTLSLALVLISALNVRADRFVLNGDTVRFWYDSPLKKYPGFAALKAKLVGFASEPCFDCTNQGFDAEWTLIDNDLYLTNIYSEYGAKEKLKADINALFGVVDNKVRASWVTQKLWTPIGKPIGYIDRTTLYKAETCYNIKNGYVMDSKHFAYPKNGTPIFITNADSSNHFLYSDVKWNKIKKLVKSRQKVIVTFISGISEKPEEIKIIKPKPKEPWAGEVIRLISTMPWPTAYVHGEMLKQAWTLPLKFTEADRKKYVH